MPLDPLKVSPNILPTQKLWRYMSLEKLIHLIDKQELFFASLHNYAKSDPFEGLLPYIALQPFREFAQQQLSYEQIKFIRMAEIMIETQGEHITADAADSLREIAENYNFSELKADVEEIYINVMKSTVINCWHQNNSESEAMWRLYSDNNKGVAIQTTAANLIASIDDRRVHFSEVKYIDFYDKNLKIEDVSVNGYVSPLIKREAFKHENEARLFFTPVMNQQSKEKPEPVYGNEYISIDINKLISKIYISPYADQLYVESVRVILEKLGIEASLIKHSTLLKSDSTLTKIF